VPHIGGVTEETPLIAKVSGAQLHEYRGKILAPAPLHHLIEMMKELMGL
jgi:hypothetical protein